MDTARVQGLRDAAEKRCAELYTQVQNLQTELERTRGEYRAFDTLLSIWEQESLENAVGVVNNKREKQKK